MGRFYSVALSFTYTAAGTDFDVVYLKPAAEKPIKLRGFSIGQISEVGDTAEEGVRLSVLRLASTVTAGAGGSGLAPVPMDSADVAAGFTARTGDSTVSTTTGNTSILAEYGWNERATPFVEWYPDERFCPKAKNAEALVIRGQTTLADDATVQVTAWVEEE